MKKTARSQRATKTLNICKGFPYEKVHLSQVGVPENNNSISYDWVYQEDENDKKQNLQTFYDWFCILWGFSLGFSETDKEGKPNKPDWKRGYQIEIRCPSGKLRYIPEKDCFEGSPVQRINDMFNNTYQLQKRMLVCLTTTKNSEGFIILPDASKWEKRLIRFNKKTGEPSIPIKLNGESDEKTQRWICKTRLFRGKTSQIYDNPSELIERHCYKMFASLNVDYVSFAICLQSVCRVQCSSMSIFKEGSSRKPVTAPTQPDAEDFVEPENEEEGQEYENGAEQHLDDATLATLLDKAQTDAYQHASVEFNDRNHQEDDEEKQDENRPSKRTRHNPEEHPDEQEDPE